MSRELLKRDPTGFKKGPKKHWPAWRYSVKHTPGADGQMGKIFQNAEDVPEGYFPTLEESEAYWSAAALPGAEKTDKPKRQELSPAEKRAAKVKRLTDAGYDPAELEKASDAKLNAALKALPDANE